MSAVERDPREDKLPKWARTLLEDLRREARSANAEAATARAENPATDGQWAWLEPWGQEPIPLPLRSYDWITCTAPGDSPAERGKDRLTLQIQEDGTLEIRGHHGLLSVLPRSSNVIRVMVDER